MTWLACTALMIIGDASMPTIASESIAISIGTLEQVEQLAGDWFVRYLRPSG